MLIICEICGESYWSNEEEILTACPKCDEVNIGVKLGLDS